MSALAVIAVMFGEVVLCVCAFALGRLWEKTKEDNR